MHILDLCIAGIGPAQGEHRLAGLHMHHRGTGLQRLCRDIAVAGKQVQHADIIDVVTTLDALPQPLGAEQLAPAQPNATAVIETANKRLVTDTHGPLARQTTAGRFPVGMRTEFCHIHPVS